MTAESKYYTIAITTLKDWLQNIMPPLVHCTVIACVVIGQSIAVALVFQTVI